MATKCSRWLLPEIPMLPNSDQGIGVFFGAIGVGVLLLLAGKAGFISISFFGFNFNRPRARTKEEIEWEREDQRAAAGAQRRLIDDAFLRYSEAAVGIVPMVQAAGPANVPLEKWFDVLASAIAAAVTVFPEDYFRVAIWVDLGDPDTFTLLGAANHDRNEPAIRKLSKDGTIAGIALKAKTGEYLCVDIKKDRRYKARTKSAKRYASIFAIRVGEPLHPWGVITVDAPRSSCFSETALLIIRRFAKLASAGAAIAVARYTPGEGVSMASPAAAAPKHVSVIERPQVAGGDANDQ